MLINIITALCLVLLGVGLVWVSAKILTKKNAERKAYVRSFKKGKCAVLYFAGIPLYLMGRLFGGEPLLQAIFDSVSDTLGLVVLKYDTEPIAELMAQSELYYYTIYLTFIMVTINALLFTISWTQQYFWLWGKRLFSALSGKDRLYIFGNNKNNICIYKSDKGRHSTVIVDKIDSKASEELYLGGVVYISTSSLERSVDEIFEHILPPTCGIKRILTGKKQRCRRYQMIINTGSDEANISLCKRIIDRINSAPEREELFSRLRVFVFGDPRYEAIYSDIIKSGSGCLNYINKYHKIALDFIDKYPLTRFMNEGQIDYGTSLLRENVDVNVVMIGFGNTGRQIFLTSVANNQFLKNSSAGPSEKRVKYHIFDKNPAENDKNLNHGYFRFKHECTGMPKGAYLPLPEPPADERHYRLDINDGRFYDEVKAVLSKYPQDINYMIIAFGSDLENIDLAEKLIEKRDEWGVKNLKIFVKSRVMKKEQTLIEQEDCYFIANESETVYNIDRILNDKLLSMAKMRNASYELERSIKNDMNKGISVDVNDEYIRQNRKRADRKWHTEMSEIRRESNIYACLSIRSKLNLMGLDYCESDKGDAPALLKSEYWNIYARDDMPDFKEEGAPADDRPVALMYTLEFKKSRRGNLAVQEHQRWNAFEISMGVIPSSIYQIMNETDENGNHTNGKNDGERRHGNITTGEGLVIFRKMVAARDGKSELETDVIKYDYQLLDEAFWLLDGNGYKIIKKET